MCMNVPNGVYVRLVRSEREIALKTKQRGSSPLWKDTGTVTLSRRSPTGELRFVSCDTGLLTNKMQLLNITCGGETKHKQSPAVWDNTSIRHTETSIKHKNYFPQQQMGLGGNNSTMWRERVQ